MNVVLRKIFGLLDQSGFAVEPGMRVLDFGCGNGDLVAQLRSLGFEAYGCDIGFKAGKHADRLEAKGFIKKLQMEPYALPFDDEFFDVIVSHQVFEHVQNYPETLGELARIQAAGGVGLHQFPPKYAPIESHVFIPFGSCIQSYWWLRMWTTLGIRGATTKGLDAKATAKENQRYLKEHTNYHSKSEIRRFVAMHFSQLEFLDLEIHRFTRLKMVYPIMAIIPGMKYVLGECHSRVMLIKK